MGALADLRTEENAHDWPDLRFATFPSNFDTLTFERQEHPNTVGGIALEPRCRSNLIRKIHAFLSHPLLIQDIFFRSPQAPRIGMVLLVRAAVTCV